MSAPAPLGVDSDTVGLRLAGRPCPARSAARRQAPALHLPEVFEMGSENRRQTFWVTEPTPSFMLFSPPCI